ncbi:MAG: thiamine-phosphate kinase [Candidatus Aminicenantes bacterium]|nr:thiamine-phosphate kinase [Candidatus Aminicenantes bacterium]NIM79060.1 thiamine-phosphate kinase [Candidatus Aminicenantes bacterium]NIN18339.1 thiamine-phosphate kinase [Candidatus Aminicenantes bacterium]NIN42226.1 thiamine-phosphate kinase [Candidatus Aminicenantes bacterium]NIN84992.1 thiamine-phosphate kinase [Candidatus Aminicenantes bacterium]
MTEAEFVKFLQDTFPFRYGKGIGDDTSVVKIGDTSQLVTTDILIENVHFRLEDFTLEELALKSLAVNLSDIAAMGGIPRYFYVGLGFPRKMGKKKLAAFFCGLEKGCRQWQVELAGGDYSSSPMIFISIVVVGEARNPIYRDNAQTNDLVGITGFTGESAIGLKMLLAGEVKTGYFIEKHKHVTPEIEKGQVLSRYVNAMIDLSDGLLIDLNRVLTASQKGARLAYEKIPVNPQIKDICFQNGWDEYEAVLAGGEDYVLLFTISEQKEMKLRNENPGLEYYIIGEINDQKGSLVVEDRGRPIRIAHLGYDHFEV